MTHLFIINPAAGRRDQTKQYTKSIRKICTARGLMYDIRVSAGPGDCTRIAREAAETGQEVRLYACGGDGTLNEVVSGAAGHPNVSVTAFSGGSGNDFIKLFDDPDAFRDLNRLLDCQEAEFDLMRCNDRYCLNICSVGLDARIGTDVSNYKRLPFLSGFRAYAVSAVINTIRGVSEHYIVELDGETVDAEHTLICACNGRFYGGGFNPVPDADPADGILDVLLVNKVSRLKVLGVIGKYKDGRYAEFPELIRHVRTKALKIRCDKPSSINLDGELLTAKEAVIRVADEKLRFFYPKGLVWRRKVPAEV